MQGYNCILIYSKNRDLLFCRRMTDPYGGKYNLVGGKILKGEDGFDAAYRELYEETGISQDKAQLHHMMDFTYYNQGCYVEIYTGCLESEIALTPEKHPLCWLPLDTDFFNLDLFAGEGNIGHIVEQFHRYGPGFVNRKGISASFYHQDEQPAVSHRELLNEPYTILCYGDSNTYGYNPFTGKHHGEEVRWPMLLQKLLGNSYRVIEEGCNGRTASCEYEDAPWKTGEYGMKPILNSHKPIDLLIIMLGTNDLKIFFDSDPAGIAKALGKIMYDAADFLLEKQEYLPDFLLISPPQIGAGIASSPFGDEFDASSEEKSLLLAAALKDIAGDFHFKKKTCHFINAADFVKVSEYDRLHLDSEGHRKLAEVIQEKISKEIIISGHF